MPLRVMLLVACFLVCAQAAYLKAWDDAEGPERSPAVPFDPQQAALLSRLQSYLDTKDRQRVDPEPPSKRQMRYNQCYFNPISCFRRRK